ncbi:hypothetical protein QUA56_08075 [Microcoleus sp. N3A4]|uniref:hypothetical protein n=1 Tax=Microcoleus sp. N3A4 TaxID=3055379 RepID=UPI002FD2943D
MATITAGTAATINATTIEGQLFQLIHFINNAEAIAGGDSNKFSLDKSEDGILTSTFSLEGQLIYTSSTGIFTESALPYLASTAFTPGSTLGTIKSATLAQYFIDAMKYAIVWQRNVMKNPQKVSGVALDFDFSTAMYSGSLSLPYASSLGSNGAIAESATEWLLT